MKNKAYSILIVAVMVATSLPSAAESEAELISVLRSNAPKAEKAITCKKLAVWGGKDAVPALATLLSDPQLAAWTRIPLETIPDPACDKALRDAAADLRGRLLVGVINSIGVRRDAEATELLIAKATDADPEVACAAAAALGRIGGPEVSGTLISLLKHQNPELRSTAAYACVRCAEMSLKDGKEKQAVSLYDSVAAADVPKQRILEATRGSVLARGEEGLAIISELLSAEDREMFRVALRLLQERPGMKISDKMVTKIEALPPARQDMALVALANSGNPQALPILTSLAKKISDEGQRAVVASMGKLGNASCVPMLVKHAAGKDENLAEAAVISLVRMPGEDVAKQIVSELKDAGPEECCVLLRIVEYRNIKEGLPLVTKRIYHPDKSVADTAVVTLARLGSLDHIDEMVALVQKKGADTALIKALKTITSRTGTKSLSALKPLLSHKSSEIREASLPLLACAGGPKSLAALVAAIEDKDPAVSDQAVRTLSVWPNMWPDDATAGAPLLEMAHSGNRQLHKVLAWRGYAEYVRNSRNMSPAAKLKAAKEVMTLAAGTAEEGQAFSLLSTIKTVEALQTLLRYTDAKRKEEAYTAISQLLMSNAQHIPADMQRNALRKVVQGSKNKQVKRQANRLLNELK